MFHLVSWQQYMIFILVVTLIYYVFILLRFYHNELFHLLKGVKNLPAIAEEKSDKKQTPARTSLSFLLVSLILYLKNLQNYASYPLFKNRGRVFTPLPPS